MRDDMDMTVERGQVQLDDANADFWSELCGSYLARTVGVEDTSAESLARFDRAYLGMYPYLDRYLPWHSGERLLEIGLGYGTVGKLLAERGLDYHGLDISPGPVGMMIHRLEMLGATDAHARVQQGSALSIPHPDGSFDLVVSIGCLHHTGDLAGAIGEVHRVLRPGGEAMIMVYNRHSFRHVVWLPAMALKRGVWRNHGRRAEFLRASYDMNLGGTAAPATEFSTSGSVRRMFAAFSEVRVRRENFEDLVLPLAGKTLAIPRAYFLNNAARLVGSDLYVVARK